MEGGQVEIRAKRNLWVEVHPGRKDGELAGHDALVIFVHGSCAYAAQVQIAWWNVCIRKSRVNMKRLSRVSMKRLLHSFILFSSRQTALQE